MKFKTYVLFFDIISKCWPEFEEKNKGCNWKNHRQFVNVKIVQSENTKKAQLPKAWAETQSNKILIFLKTRPLPLPRAQYGYTQSMRGQN